MMQQRNSPAVGPAIALIVEGGDIWSDTTSDILVPFCNIYLFKYSALPTNTQFTERGFKESGVVSLGKRGETNRSIFYLPRKPNSWRIE